jgi:transposase
MFRLSSDLKVFIHREAVDFRLNINGLALLVEQTLKLDPFAVAAYVFRYTAGATISVWLNVGVDLKMSRRAEF